MPLFGYSRHKNASPSPSTSGLPSAEASNGQGLPAATPTVTKSKSKFKSLLKPKSSSTDKLERDVQHLNIESNESDQELCNKRQNKRISTIVEAEVEDAKRHNDDYDSDYDLSDASDFDSDLDDDESFDEHAHAIKIRGKSLSIQSNLASQLSSIMGYCGITSTSTNPETLATLANEELKRTFSLFDLDMKIHQLSATTDRKNAKLNESVIGDKQVQLIEKLQVKLSDILSLDPNTSKLVHELRLGKTVYDRYGVVRDIIGRGAYGLIKIIDPNATDATLKSTTKLTPGKVFYAVKELRRRPGTDLKHKETNKQFIDRVISEFIVSSTLNYKHIVKTVDLMVTFPSDACRKASPEYGENIKINQVMECTTGGDLFTYMTMKTDKANQQICNISLEEIDCFVKQIAKGLGYMHQHGVAHCDLKLENILVNYLPPDPSNPYKTKIILKLSDFGKANVFRTKWDEQEQMVSYTNGPIGSEPYMAPEEHLGKLNKLGGYSARSKDSWAMGIVILVLFNISKHYFTHNKVNVDDDRPAEISTIFDEYSSGYLWQGTEIKMHHLKKTEDKKYKDKVFDEYTRTRMIADYDDTTKEWLIKKEGSFKPIENLFVIPKDEEGAEFSKCKLDEDELQICELRKMFIYKLLDPNPATRLTIPEFVKGDWLASVESCYDN